MDAAVSAASHGSLQNFSAPDNSMYLVRVYEEQPATAPTNPQVNSPVNNDRLTNPESNQRSKPRRPEITDEEPDWISQEQSLLQQLKSTAVSNSTSSVKR